MKFINFLLILFFIISCKSTVRGIENNGGSEPPRENRTFTEIPPKIFNPTLIPTKLIVISPLTFTEIDSLPVVEIQGVVSGLTVKLFLDKNCVNPISEGLATNSIIRLTPSKSLSLGSYFFYASTSSGNMTSGCSLASQMYTYSLLPTVKQPLPLMPSALALQSPGSSSGTINTPTILVSGLKPGEEVRIYTNPSCSNQVGMAVSLGNTAAITTSPLQVGSHTFYANSSNSSGISPCSISSVNYNYGFPPAPPSSLSRAYPVTSSERVLNPIFTVSGVSAGSYVRLFKDPGCLSKVGEAMASGTSVNITTSLLREGFYNFYANSTNFFGTSECSLAKAIYQVVSSYSAVTPAQLNSGLRNSFQPCGIEESSIEGKIQNCSKINNGSTVTFDSISGATWKLVTKNLNLEIWKDMKSGLVWSGNLGKTNWCQAAGDASGVLNSQCSRSIYQPQYPNAESFCEESQAVNLSSKTEAGVNAFLPSTWNRIASSKLQEHWSSGAFHPSKGFMGSIASTFGPSVSWRLPTKTDIDTAFLNGFREIVLGMVDEKFWSSSVYSMNIYTHRWFGDSIQKKTWYADVGTELSVRCVFLSK